MYRVVITEGSLGDQTALLHPDVLVSIWDGLVLPERVRTLWENRFPVLRA